ncbi:hypothetical protein [Pseudoruegeria sp. HB172150]|uniref:spike base protein, RCAP_Rcc01079 family n=1 Tax=Pseudoruegeria sp. HB172150 TaxID=2721164 RepID=UPI0015532E9A|nr:hypothetical protein [Pseudoruegeria sp. HB172150]
MADRYDQFKTGPVSPAIGGFAVTPDDDTDLTEIPRALYIGGAGSLDVTMMDGTNLTFAGLSAGAVLPIRPSRILETSSATGIVALY